MVLTNYYISITQQARMAWLEELAMKFLKAQNMLLQNQF